MTTLEQARTIVEALKTADPAIVNLPKACDQLLDFIAETQVKVDAENALNGLSLAVQDLKLSMNHVTESMTNFEKSAKAQQEQVVKSDQDYKQLANRIGETLINLDQYLRRHT